MYRIRLKRSAEKELQKLSGQILKNIVPAIDSLAINPRPPGSKKLKGNEANLWRFRIGDYRIVYKIEDEIKIVEIRRVGHRKDIYKK